MNMTEPERCTCSTRRPGEVPTDYWQGGLKLQCSEVVDRNGPAHRDLLEVQSTDDPSPTPHRWECDRVSPSSPSHCRLRELLRVGSSKTGGLDRLREKICLQRLDRMSAVTPNDPQHTLVTHKSQITRKICRVKFDPPTPLTTNRGLGIVGVKSIDHHVNPPSSMLPPSMEKTQHREKDVSQTDVVCHSDTHAKNKAQPGLGPHQKNLPSPTQMENSDPNRTGGKRIFLAKQCKPVVRGRRPAPGISNRNLQESTQIPKPSNTTSKISFSKRNLPLKSPISTPGTSSNYPSKKIPPTSSDKPVRQLNRSRTESKVLSYRSPTPTVTAGSSLGPASGWLEGKGPEWPLGTQRYSAQKVREFMDQKEKERRRKEQQKKEEMQREVERRKACVQEVLHKQKVALNRAKRRPQNIPQVDQGVIVTGQSQEVSHCRTGKWMPRRVWQGKGCSKVEQVTCMPGRRPSLGSGMFSAEKRAQRLKALRQSAAVLGIRVEEEASRLRTAAGCTFNPTPGLTGPAMWPECQSRSTVISKDLPWSGEPLSELEDTENMVTCATAATSHSGVGVQGSVAIIKSASEPLWSAQDLQTPTEELLTQTVPDAAEQQLPVEEGRVTPQSKHSDSSDNTETTSKWSELSGFFGHRELLGQLSLVMFQQSLREEELRARHHSALCRLREEALWEKTQTEIAWLEHRRGCLRVGEEGTLADITKKQEEVVNRMRQEQAEIQHWRNLYQSGRHQRKLLLRQQNEVVEIRRSTAQLKQQLQEQKSLQLAQSRVESRGDRGRSQETDIPRATPPCDNNIHATRPGVMVDVKATSEPCEEDSLERKALEDSQQLGWGTFSTKTTTGVRRLLSSEDVRNWRRQGSATDEMAPAEQGELRAPQFRYPSSLAGHPEKAQPPPQKSFQAEGRDRHEEEEGLHQSGTKEMTEIQLPQDYPTAFVSEELPKTLPPPSVKEESSPPERVRQEEESWSDESSSSGGPLRVRSLPDFAEVSWKSQKSIGSFASLPEFQRAAAVCMNVSEMSGPSSDVEEDLPLDLEDGGWRPAGNSSEGDWEQSTEDPNRPHPALVGEARKGIGNTVSLNVQNDHRFQSVLTVNNNCEIMSSSCATALGDCPGLLLEAGTSPGSPVPDAGSRDAESSSADYSLSETEEGSEALSFSSECLISSGEEDPDQAILGTEAEEQGMLVSHPSGSGASSPSSHNTSPPRLMERQPISEEQTSERESEINNPNCFVSLWEPPAPEETLSEILSPVDEILSYGSTELPPTVTDDLMLLPPQPACEVITWTSEDGFPPPPEEQCEPHPLEDPSIKSDDLPSLSDDPLLPVNTGLPAGLTNRCGNDGDSLKVDLVTTGHSAGHRLCDGQGKVDVKSPQFSSLSTAEDDENSNSSDPLSSFQIGDRVLVCGSRPGHLRFKGITSFASGHWAGVALDQPVGNHDGMFRGVRYFQCSKNCGVLVRAEDISRLLSEQESDQETRADDPFSDEEPPNATKPPQDRWPESMDKPSGTGVEKSMSQSQGGERGGGVRGHSSAPQISSNIFSRELNNNPPQSPTPVCEDEVTATEPSSARTCGDFDPAIYEAHGEGDIHWESHQQVMLEAEGNNSCLINSDFWNSVSFTGDLRGSGGPNYLLVGGGPQNFSKGPPEMRSDSALLVHQHSTSQTPLDCLGSPLEETEMATFPARCAEPQVGRVGPDGRCINDLDTLVDNLMGKLLMEVVKEAEEVRTKYCWKRSRFKKKNHIQSPQALGKSDGGQVKPSLNPNPNQRPSPPCFSDQWRCSLASAAQPRVRVEPHDPGVVHRLVAESVEALWGQTGGHVTNSTEAPAYLASDESRRAYRQVIFDLTSDIYHKALRCHWGTSVSPWELNETSSVSPVWSSKTSLQNVKAAIQEEVQRELNLKRTDVQTQEMMQNLCKYRTVHRDRVDYILIQELHKEEQQWVDYSLDQLNVKMQLTEEIFDILLQDTISVLNQIYAAPSGDSPPALQPFQSSLIP